MTREKRSEVVRARITPSLREQIERDLSATSNVLSISDWLYEAIEERLALRTVLPRRSGAR